MIFNIMTLFPKEVGDFLSSSIIGRAQKKGIIEVNCYDIRDYSLDKHRKVDDYSYSGGQGMLMQADPICRLHDDIKEKYPDTHTVFMSPKGKKLTQARAKKLLKYNSITILCGHYEGVDQRAIDLIADEEISVGDYVLTGGELPAMILTDTVARMIKGVLSEEACFEDESIYSGLLEYPQYTRPPVYRGLEVPSLLLNGDSAKIADWKLKQSLKITKERRKDLYAEYMKKRMRTLNFLDKKRSEKKFGKVYSLMQKTYEKGQIRTYEASRKLFRNKAYDINILENEKEIIGFISAFKFDTFILLDLITVVNKFRQKGYGEQMISRYIKENKSSKYVLSLKSFSEDDRNRLIPYFETFGFKTVSSDDLYLMSTSSELSENESEKIVSAIK